MTVDEVLSGNRDFYQKVFQQNGYYPINKFVYHADTDEYEQFVQKISGWKSWGISKAVGISNKEWLRYIFEHQACVFSHEEMINNYSHDTE